MKTIASAPLAENVMMPQYDRQQLKTRIVHFGFGAFHRAHQALLTDRVLNAQGGDWGICEISLFSGDRLMSQLREQDHLFTVLEKGPTATNRLLSAPSTNVSTPCWIHWRLLLKNSASLRWLLSR